jgi:hypothetical protein
MNVIKLNLFGLTIQESTEPKYHEIRNINKRSLCYQLLNENNFIFNFK